MSHTTHTYVMVGLLVAGTGLFLSGGVGGGVLFLLWPLLCLGSMLAMVWFMSGTSTLTPPHTHGEGAAHSHDEPAPGR